MIEAILLVEADGRKGGPFASYGELHALAEYLIEDGVEWVTVYTRQTVIPTAALLRPTLLPPYDVGTP